MLPNPTPVNSSGSPPLVKKRCVFYLIGYEPLPQSRIHTRFERELDHFRRTWNVTAKLSPLTAACGGMVPWRIDSAGPNWRVETDVLLLDWSDIVVADFAQPMWRVILRGLAAIFDFLLSGAPVGYLRTNWRYLFFYAYPILLLGLFATGGFTVAWFAVANGLPWPSILGPLLGIACVALLVHWAGRKLHLYYALLDWSFAADIVHRRRPAFEVNLDRLARVFAERLRASVADEIVVFGYSLGAVIMMQVVARALQQDSQLTRHVTRINLVSAGSSILKIGLHPAAEHFRVAVHKVIDEPAIFWVEYQAIVDIFNFYNTDPVVELGLPACGKPIVKLVRIRNMVKGSSYRRMRWNPLRLHLQFALGNERRYGYDFYMICCGPLPLQSLVERPPDDVVTAIAPDGTYQAHFATGAATGTIPATIVEVP